MTAYETTRIYESAFDKDPKSLLVEMHSEEQKEPASCGAAVITDVLKTLGHDVTQKEIINEVRKGLRQMRPEGSDLSVAYLGTPPELMEGILANHEIHYTVKKHSPVFDGETQEEGGKFLDEMLASGHVIICPIQTIPNHGEARNINNDGHYVIVCGSVEKDGKKFYVTIDPMFHYYQRLSNEGSLYSVHMGDMAPEGLRKTSTQDPRSFTETRDKTYTDQQLSEFPIDPKQYGYRLIERGHFLQNWRDISGFGQQFNLYGVAVEMETPFDKLPADIKRLARRLIENKNISPEPWRASPDEKYGLRRFNGDRSEETQRFYDIDRHPNTLKYMLPATPSPNEDMDYLLMKRPDEESEGDDRIMWAIVDERNEPVGWVQFYKDERMTTERRAELGIPENALILETSYSKLFTQWPGGSRFVKDRPNIPDTQNYGVAVNGLRQSLLLLREMEERSANLASRPARSIFVTAYTDPDNTASEAVPQKIGFKQMGLVDYEGGPNNFWIIET